MAAPTIPNGEEQFFTTLYEGNGAGQRVGKFVPFTDNGTIANSVIFNSADSADRLMATIGTSSTANARRKMTLSFWYKWTGSGTNYQTLWTVGGDGQTPYIAAYINNNGSRPKGSITFFDYTGSGSSYNSMIETKGGFTDTSKWYHVLFAMDTTQSTDSDRLKIYVDGNLQETDTNNYYSQDFDTGFGTNVAYAYGTNRTVSSGGYWFDGYLAEINHVDGTALTPSTFGLTDTSTGRWIPKTLTGITYGDNGHRLKFQDSSALGDDTSGNGNDFTATDLASANQTTDSPTQNHCIMDSNITAGSPTLAEGNTKITGPSSDYGKSVGTLAFNASTSTGYYWEVTFTNSNTEIGIMNNQKRPTASNSSDVGATILQARGGGGGNTWWFNQDDVELADTGVTHSSSHRIQVAVKNGNIWFGYNNTWFLSGNPSTGANPAFTGLESRGLQRPYFAVYDAISMTIHINDDDWSYTPPTGFVSLNQDNLQTTDKGISGLVWTKNRDATDNHQLYDSSRGKQKTLHPNTNDQESTTTDGLQKFLIGGQQIEDDVSINTASESFVTWNWVGNSGSTSSNTTGSVTSTVQANTTAGFSIVRWTGGGSAATVGHGLSQTPEWIFYKRTNATGDGWVTYHKDQNASPASGSLVLNGTNAFGADSTLWNNTAPTSSVISIGTYGMQSSEERTAWVWHSVDGFSKFGKYEGNNSADGTFVYLGFKPAWVMIKSIDSGSSSYPWCIYDNKRSPINPVSLFLSANDTVVDNTLDRIDFLSNGFKLRQSYSYSNAGETYIYVAFAEHPFVGDGTSPVTAR